MNPKATKAINQFAAILFTLGGLTCLGLAGYLILRPAPAKQAQYVGPKPDKAGCVKALQSLGFQVQKPEASVLSVESAGLDAAPKELVGNASLAIAACHVPMRSFCMGEGCSIPGVTFTLDFADSKK